MNEHENVQIVDQTLLLLYLQHQLLSACFASLGVIILSPFKRLEKRKSSSVVFTLALASASAAAVAISVRDYIFDQVEGQ